MSGSKAREAAARAIRATPCQNGDTIGTALYCSPILDVDISELDDVCRTIANAAIDAYIAARRAEGFVEVPREPTEAMHVAGMNERRMQDDLNRAHNVIKDTSDIYRAMLNAAEPPRRER